MKNFIYKKKKRNIMAKCYGIVSINAVYVLIGNIMVYSHINNNSSEEKETSRCWTQRKLHNVEIMEDGGSELQAMSGGISLQKTGSPEKGDLT